MLLKPLTEFAFEKKYLTRRIVEFVSKNFHLASCRNVLDTHEKAQRVRSLVDIAAYEQALVDLVDARPWEAQKESKVLTPYCEGGGEVVI